MVFRLFTEVDRSAPYQLMGVTHSTFASESSLRDGVRRLESYKSLTQLHLQGDHSSQRKSVLFLSRQIQTDRQLANQPKAVLSAQREHVKLGVPDAASIVKQAGFVPRGVTLCSTIKCIVPLSSLSTLVHQSFLDTAQLAIDAAQS